MCRWAYCDHLIFADIRCRVSLSLFSLGHLHHVIENHDNQIIVTTGNINNSSVRDLSISKLLLHFITKEIKYALRVTFDILPYELLSSAVLFLHIALTFAEYISHWERK